ncbi:MAG TPA: two-component system response regulator [Cyanothece sp. UBA12306]|nr:two-component system response regulator [Cyanothece sp. UBA12306]
MTTHKILVIDDSKVVRMRIRDMLPDNFDVLEAKDGAEGYNLIRSQKPNLIMLDFLLPKMSGWEVYQEIQKEYDLKVIPLVLMSGLKKQVLEKISEPFEFFSFVEKPFEQKELVDAIRDAMAKAKKHPKPPESGQEDRSKTSGDTASMAAEIESLRQQLTKMQKEIDGLKNQLSQVINFIKQKLK